MAAYYFLFHYNPRILQRNRIFRDRLHPLEIYNDAQILRNFRLPRESILQITEELKDSIDFNVRRRSSLTPVLQVLLALRFYATGTFQNVVGDLIGVNQSTACRAINRVTEALVKHVPLWIKLPNQQGADRIKQKFYQMQGLPNVIGCIDGTHIRIKAPSENAHEYVNRKNYHSINVQVICDADLIFINVIARWPGSVHDARILRQSDLFRSFEGNQPPLDGIILGDSGYMLRTWLMTPLQAPHTRQEERYNFAHSSTRTTVERSIGVAKQRWQCLRSELRLEPAKACRVILVCLMLHNRARHLRLALPEDFFNSDDEDGEDGSDNENAGHGPDDTVDQQLNERARTAAGKVVRDRIIRDCY